MKMLCDLNRDAYIKLVRDETKLAQTTKILKIQNINLSKLQRLSQIRFEKRYTSKYEENLVKIALCR